MGITIILGEKHDHHAQHMLSSCIQAGLNAHLFDGVTIS